MRAALIGALLALVPIGEAAAQRLDAFSFRWDTRYDNQDAGAERDRVQGSVRLALTVDAWSLFEIVGFASTGGSYTSRWTTLRDFIEDDSPADFSLYFRHLYLQRRWKWGRVQLGAIPPIKNIASGTGLNSSGWVDGARFEIYQGDLTLEWVTGSVGQLDTPDLFARSYDHNFFEFEASWDVTERLTLEASAEWLEGSAYLRSEGRVEVPLWRGRSLAVRAELIGNLTREVMAGDVGLSFDLVEWITGDVKKRLGVDLAWRYLDPAIGLRGQLVDDFYTFGQAATVELGGLIVEDGVLHWFARGVIAQRPRVLAGLGLRFTQ